MLIGLKNIKEYQNNMFYKNILKNIKDIKLFSYCIFVFTMLLMYYGRKYFENEMGFYYNSLFKSSGKIIFNKEKLENNLEFYRAIRKILSDYMNTNYYDNDYLYHYLNANMYYIRKVIQRIWYNRKFSDKGKSKEYKIFNSVVKNEYENYLNSDYFVLWQYLNNYDEACIRRKAKRRVEDQKHEDDGYCGNDFFDKGFPYDNSGEWIV